MDVDPGLDPDLIVMGERIGDLPAVGAPGADVRDSRYDETFAVTEPPSTYYGFSNEAGQRVVEIGVCNGTDRVHDVVIFNVSENERFVTPEGVSIKSSEADVLARLGEPDGFAAFAGVRVFRYEVRPGVVGLGIVFDEDEPSESLLLGVGDMEACE